MIHGILNVLKVAAGKKPRLELPADMDTSSIDAAVQVAVEIAEKYLAEHPASEYQIVTRFTHPEQIHGKPVFIEINHVDWNDEPFINLFLPVDDKESKRLMKKYMKARNLSVEPTLLVQAFEHPGYQNWGCNLRTAFFTDVIAFLGLNPSAPWQKGETNCSVTASTTID